MDVCVCVCVCVWVCVGVWGGCVCVCVCVDFALQSHLLCACVTNKSCKGFAPERHYHKCLSEARTAAAGWQTL